MASPSNNRGGNKRPTGGKAGGRAGKPAKPIAGTKDKTVRVPASWNAQVVDPTNNRGAGQRPTGGQAGGRAGKPSGGIARPLAKPAVKPPGIPAGIPANYQMMTNPTQNRGAGQRTTGGQAGGRAGLPSGAIARPKPTSVATRPIMGGGRNSVAAAVGQIATTLLDPLARAAGTQLGNALRPLGRAIDDRLPGVNSKDEARRTAAKQPLRQMTAQERSKAVRLQQAEPKDMSGRPKPPTVPSLPSSVRSSASSGGGRNGGSSRGSSSSTSRTPARPAAPPAPAKPGQKWEEFNPNRGTSKSNNPLLNSESGGIKLRDRMKNREDKDQASSASKLTSKFDKDSGYQAKDKVDGSNVDTKKKLRSTTNEYDPKKRRYGG